MDEKTMATTVIGQAELKELQLAKEELARVNRVLDALENALTSSYRWKERSPSDKIQEFQAYFQRSQEKKYQEMIQMRDTMIAQMRAMEIVVSGILMASTHREKDARLRGLSDVIAVGIDQLISLSTSWFSISSWDKSLLRSDSSIPMLQKRLWEKEQLLEKYMDELAKYQDKGLRSPVTNAINPEISTGIPF